MLTLHQRLRGLGEKFIEEKNYGERIPLGFELKLVEEKENDDFWRNIKK